MFRWHAFLFVALIRHPEKRKGPGSGGEPGALSVCQVRGERAQHIHLQT
jgi:hypothetical protein